MNMKFLSLTLTLLSLTAISAVAAPAPEPAPVPQVPVPQRPDPCVGRYCTVYPEPWSAKRKNVTVDCATNSFTSFEWCNAGCENGVCL